MNIADTIKESHIVIVGVCEFLVDVSGYCPGWAKDQSKINFYQFGIDMLDFFTSVASKHNKNYLEEIYQIANGYWIKSDRESAKHCHYRKNKGGAGSVVCISIY